MRSDYTEMLSIAVSSILRSYAFFNNCRILAFTLHSLKKSIATLESQTSTLADCYLRLVRLEAAIKKLLKNDY